MDRNNNHVKKRKRGLDKQSSASIVLAFTVICFLSTMFVISKQIGVSYAVPESVPSRLTADISFLPGATAWTFMGNEFPLRYTFKATDNNGVSHDMYCIERQNTNLVTGSIYTNPEPLDSSVAPGLAFILNNSYPNNPDSSYMTGLCNNDNVSHYGGSLDVCKRYLTQYAVWRYLGTHTDYQGKPNFEQSEIYLFDQLVARAESETGTDVQMAKAVNKLVVDAINYNNSHQESISISIDKDIQYTVTEDGKYLESNEIGLVTNQPDKLKSYSVNFSSDEYGAVVVDSVGNEISVFSGTTKFKVRIPVEGLKDKDKIDLNFTINGNFSTDTVYAYSSGNNQRPIISDITEFSVASGMSIKVNLTQFTKTDITNGKLVEGAELAILDKDGKELHKWITTPEPHYVSLDPGDYILKEITSPDGYELNEEVVPFTVKGDGTIDKVEMKNTPTTKVPDTAENVPIYLYIIGAMILLMGLAVIYVTTKPKSNKQ